MDVGLTVSIVLLISGALLLILYPLWQQTRTDTKLSVTPIGQTLEEYQARYQALLAAIKDLMFDHEMGKVSTEDYQALLNKTKLEAAQVRQQIDRLSQSSEAAPAVDTSLDTEIETLVASARQESAVQNESLLQEVDAEIETLKNLRSDGAGHTCPACGNSLHPDDAFCSRCGQPVEPNAEPTCPQCGFAFEPDDTFCARCGAALDTAPQPQNYQDAKI